MAKRKAVKTPDQDEPKKELGKYEGDPGIVNRWLKEIELVQQSQRQQDFENFGERILKIFRNQSDLDTVGTGYWQPNVMFNVLWSNVQVLEPALYSRMPKVVVERVFKDTDPVGRFACEIAERATHFNLLRQQDMFNYGMSSLVQDRLLPGRGGGKLEYSSEFIDATDPETDEPIIENGEAVRVPKPNTERVDFKYVHWLDYLESTSRNQFEVRWRAVRIYMSRAKLIKEFGAEIGECVELGQGTRKKSSNQDDDAEFLKQAAIWVIEELDSKMVYWISEGYREGPLKVEHDPFKLKGFWSFPLPLTATTTSDSTIPIADYVIYKGLADELNYVASRLRAIINCIRLVGAHAKSFDTNMRNIMQLPDGTTWPIADWGAFTEKSGFKGMLDWVPFEQCVAAVPVLQEYQASLKSQIDEITSMPDIVRGSSDPNDPVYTQQQKSHWTVIKLVKKQQDVQRFCREVISKMAQMIFEPGFFSDETIWLMAGVGQLAPDKQAMFPEAIALLRDDRLNTFRIDIETDSTIAIDEADAAQRWFEYINTMKGLVGDIVNMEGMAPELVNPMIESALQAARTLRTGRSVEGAWEKALEEREAARKAAAENPQPPPPDPALLKAQVDQMRAQIEGQKAQHDAQLATQKEQFAQWESVQRLQLDSMKTEGELKVKNDANIIAAGQNMSRSQIDRLFLDIDMFQQQFKAQLDGVSLELEKERLEFDKQAKVLEMKEKLMEEERLDRQEILETQRMVLEHRTAIKEAELQAKEQGIKEREKAEPRVEKPQAPPVVNVLISGGKKRIRKTGDGTYESEEVGESA